MTDQIDAAIAAAQEAASNAPTGAQLTPAQNTAVAPNANSGALDMGLTGFLTSGGINPDMWIKVNEDGIKLDKSQKGLVEEFDGEIDFSQVKLFQGARVQLPGGKYEYIKTYDGVTESRSGKPFTVALSEINARAVGDAASPYRGADIPIKLTSDVKQGTTTVEAGKIAGTTTPVTGFKAFQSFLGGLVQAGKVTVGADGRTMAGVVATKVTHEPKSSGDNNWGILNFEAA